MPDRDPQHFAILAATCKQGRGRFHSHIDRLADIFQPDIAHQRARQQPRFAEDLKPVADAQHNPATRGEFLHRLHDRRKARNGSRAQVVAVCKATWHQDCVAVLQIVRLVPQECYRLLGDLLNRPVGIMVAVRSRKNQHAKLHRELSLGGMNLSLTRLKHRTARVPARHPGDSIERTSKTSVSSTRRRRRRRWGAFHWSSFPSLKSLVEENFVSRHARVAPDRLQLPPLLYAEHLAE